MSADYHALPTTWLPLTTQYDPADTDMADVFSPSQRSTLMSRIRSRDTKPEVALRRALWGAGCRFRVNWRHREVGVRIDVAAPGRRLAVFVDGCFWHGCPSHAVTPKSNTDFWVKKIKGNMVRDLNQTRALRRAGWRVVRVWEHEIKQADRIVERLVPMWLASDSDELQQKTKRRR